jgi:uncharacterized membrane protein YfcA
MSAASIIGVWLATITPAEWANPLLSALLTYAVIQLAFRTIRSMRRG